FFDVEDAVINPVPDPAVPVIIGGRSDAALDRTARYGDGWVGAWCSPRRFLEATGIIDNEAAAVGRTGVSWQHGYQPWVGIGDTAAEARNIVAGQMEGFYGVPFQAFENYVPVGTPAEVAAALAPFVDAGCSILNLKVAAATDAESISAAAEIATSLKGV
ncbi:MAG: LLM class flavin-dependent oxidoreductase, partial [Acidimicrobiales bacterium]